MDVLDAGFQIVAAARVVRQRQVVAERVRLLIDVHRRVRVPLSDQEAAGHVEDRRTAQRASRRIRALQAGSIHAYLLYIFITLLLLLLFAL